jgi:hypothetical protein
MKVSLVQKIRLKELKGKINMGNRLNLLRNNMKKKGFILGERITNTNNKKKDIIINLFKSMRRKRESMRHNKNKFQKPIMF